MLCALTRCLSLFPLFFSIYCFVTAIYANKDVYKDAAYCCRSSVAGICVCLVDITVSCAKTAEPIEIQVCNADSDECFLL